MKRFLPIPFEGEHTEQDLELFGPYRELWPIRIEGRVHWVPAGISVLRALQYVVLREGTLELPWANYCWNNTVGCCEMVYQDLLSPTPHARSGRACLIHVKPGLDIVRLPRGARTVVGEGQAPKQGGDDEQDPMK